MDPVKLYEICLLNDDLIDKYEAFLYKGSTTMLYASNDYRVMLKLLLGAQDYYFIALDSKDEIVGALPAFLSKNGKYGPVLNSLPFYGSNGAVIEHNGNIDVIKELISSFQSFANEHSCASSTIVTSPFEKNTSVYDDFVDYDYKESRIGQITKFPADSSTLDDDLMSIFHYKTRNMIRKAQNNSITISDSMDSITLRYLIDTHTNNMQEIGGIPKQSNFFELLGETFKREGQYKIFTAYKDDIPISALLLFYFNNTVEYYTPVIQKEFRSLQPMSLLVFHAMKDAINKGYMWWNWGGTWRSLNGVYDFKKRWGTEDHSYYYYTKIYNNELAKLSKETILEEYPNFFVIPFGDSK